MERAPVNTIPRVLLKRFEYHNGCTVGRLEFEDFGCYTLEPEWRNNEIAKSCIPTGEYTCVRRRSPKYGYTYWLQGTDPRTWVLIHPGNLAKHTRGCILLGMRFGWINKQRAILNSRKAIRRFETIMNKEPFRLTIL